MATEVVTDRRERILRAASRHFAAHPYEKVSTVAIATDADVNRGWIYHEFGSKRDLYLAVLQRTVRTPSLPPLSGLLDAENVEQAITEMLDEWLDQVVENRESYLAMYRVHAGNRSDPVIRGILREMHEGTIDNALRTVIPDPAAAPPAARALVACFGELTWQALWEWLESGRFDREQVHLVLTKSLTMLFELVPKVAA